ncbi:MAG: hypothetical protein PHC70_00175 [Patescibacteria group bacterium]|nr:hypothetical protein [Patescibacteria group bacterium]
MAKTRRRKLSELTDTEARAEGERLRDRLREADRIAAPRNPAFEGLRASCGEHFDNSDDDLMGFVPPGSTPPVSDKIPGNSDVEDWLFCAAKWVERQIWLLERRVRWPLRLLQLVKY